MKVLRALCSVGMFLLLLTGFIPSSANASAAEELSLYGLVESFTWREFDSSGQLLRESGPLLGIGVSVQFKETNNMTINVRGELFGGQVDYVGQACDILGNCEPATSNTNYFGMKGEGDLGYRFALSPSSYLEPFAGLGLRWWLRDINDGTTASGNPTGGYVELWYSLYLRLGLRGGHSFSKDKHAFAEFGVKLPVYNENYIDAWEVTLEPGIKSSLFAEAGMKFNRIKVSAFYEGFRFSPSDAVFVGVGPMGPEYIYQPESDSDIYGIRVGVVF